MLLLSVGVAGCWGNTTPPKPPPSLVERIDASLTSAGQFLTAQQDKDGAFRGSTYGAFKDGYSLTPLATHALLFVPHSPKAQKVYTRGAEFMATLVVPGEPTTLRLGIDGPTYPLYAAAGALLVLSQRPAKGRFDALRDALIPIVLERQLTEARGWNKDDLSYGGWGYFRGIPDKPAPGQPLPRGLAANLSTTLFAVGALRLGGVPVEHPAMSKALVFVERCQNYGEERDDGGFFFSPALPDSNKAGRSGKGPTGEPQYRSYGSMTADGARALVRLGRSMDHPRVKQAAAWLHTHFDATRNPGEFPKQDEVRRRSSYFYYVWSAAHALRLLGQNTFVQDGARMSWAESLTEALIAQQRTDGSWANSATEMREDEPVVATAFAVAGLAVGRMVLTGEWQTSFGHRN